MAQYVCARNGREQTKQTAPLFDHLVGEQLDRVGHIEAKRPGRLQVDDKLEFGGLRDRQVGGLHAPEDSTGVDADLTIHVRNIGPIAHQPTGFDKFALGIGRGNPVMCSERHKLGGPASEERVGRDQESVGPVARKRGEGLASISGLVLALRSATLGIDVPAARPRRKRPRCRAADKRDELAPFHCPMRPVLPTEKHSTAYGRRLTKDEEHAMSDDEKSPLPGGIEVRRKVR
jgi:hypothetical protein